MMEANLSNYLEYVEENLMNAGFMPSKFPFLKDEWLGHIFVSGDYFLNEDFIKLRRAIQRVIQDEEIFVLDFGLYENFLTENLVERANNNAFWDMKFEWKDFDSLVQNSEYGTSGVYIWGKSLTWGVIAPDYTFNCVGGEPRIIKSIEQEFGGSTEIKDELIGWLKENPDIFGEELFKSFYS